MRHLTFVFASLLMMVVAVTASVELEQMHRLFKREDKLPYDTLPNTNCHTPSVCSNINQPVSCRCDDIVTVCHNQNGQFCWGSQKLNQTTNCPSIPDSCSSQFNGTASCLCNGDTVLCVDGYNHYCYGTYSGDAATASVSLQPFPEQSSSATSSSDSSESSNSGESAAVSLKSMNTTFLAAIVGFLAFFSL